MLRKLTYLSIVISLMMVLTGCDFFGNTDKEITITFDSQGGSAVSAMVVTLGEEVSLPTPTKTGHQFMGWFLDLENLESKLETISILEESITLYAIWEINQYTVLFYVGEDMIHEVFVNHGGILPFPSNPTKQGYSFVGWFLDVTKEDSQWQASQTVTNNVELHAKWSTNQYTVVFVDYNDTVLQQTTVSHGSVVVQPSPPTRDGYNFIGWDIDSFVITSNKTIRALYEQVVVTMYQVVLDYQDDTTVEIIDMEDESTLQLPILEREGYLFLGWEYNGVMVEDDVIVKSDMEFLAIWEEDKDVVITIRVPSGGIAALMQTFVQEFQEQYPHITVVIDSTSGGYDSMRQLTMMDLQKNQAPTMVVGYTDHFAEYYVGGGLVNLEQFIQGVDGFTEAEIQDFIPSLLNQGRGFDADNPMDVYTLPLFKSTEVMYYNKTILDALMDKDPVNIFIPRTWEEVSTVSARIIEMIADGEVDGLINLAFGQKSSKQWLQEGRFIPFGYDFPASAFTTIINQWNGTYVNTLGASKGIIGFHHDLEVVQALEFFQQEAAASRFGIPESFGATYISNPFLALQTIMVIGSTTGARFYLPNNNLFEVGIASVPINEQAVENNIVMQQGANIGILNQASSKEQHAAWMFLRFLMEPETTMKIAMELDGHIPVRKSTFEHNELQLFMLNAPDNRRISVLLLEQLFKYMDEDVVFYGEPSFFGANEVRNQVADLMSRILLTEDSVSEQIAKTKDELGGAYLELEPVLDFGDIPGIYFSSDINNATNDLKLQQFAYVDNEAYEITWTSGVSDYFNIVTQNNQRIGLVTRPFVGGQQEVELIATIAIEGVAYTRIWTVYIKQVPSSETVYLSTVKGLPNNSLVEVVGYVTHVDSRGVMIQDASGGMYVFLNTTPAANVKPGAFVKVEGTKVVFYGMPQLSSPTITVLQDASLTGFTYDVAPPLAIDTLNSALVSNLDQYGKMGRITGVVVKDVRNNAGTLVSQYGIKDVVTDQVAIIYNSSSNAVKLELEAMVGKTVSMVVIVHDFHSTQLVWRNWGIAGTIVEVTIEE